MIYNKNNYFYKYSLYYIYYYFFEKKDYKNLIINKLYLTIMFICFRNAKKSQNPSISNSFLLNLCQLTSYNRTTVTWRRDLATIVSFFFFRYNKNLLASLNYET